MEERRGFVGQPCSVQFWFISGQESFRPTVRLKAGLPACESIRSATQNPLDPSVVALTKAIGHQESGGDYNKVGDNGHSAGAYQWNNPTPLAKGQIPKNFASFASEVGADPNDFSPTNQDKVAYQTRLQLLQAY